MLSFKVFFFLLGAIGLELKNLCVIESAAKYHPNNQIYVLMTSPILQDPYMNMLLSKYINIQVQYVHMASLIQDSPLKSLWNQESIQSSKYLTSHLRFSEFQATKISKFYQGHF